MAAARRRSGGTGWAAATSAQAGGGMDALVAEAKKEGTLNVIALPPDWANYGAILKAFTDKYGIKVNSANPDGSSQDEINAVKQLGTQDRAPDVLDVGQSFANGNTALFAPYKVATWDSIPATNKDAERRVGQRLRRLHLDRLQLQDRPELPHHVRRPAQARVQGPGRAQRRSHPGGGGVRGRVGGRRSPTAAASTTSSPASTFWGKVAKAGNLLKVDPNSATIESGQTPIVLDWDYLNVTAGRQGEGVVRLEGRGATDGLFAQYYAQAINKNAPHPAAARLWQEFLYSDEGQNLWLAGKSRPVRLNAMQQAGTADKAALAALPQVTGEPQFPTQAQTDAAQKAVAQGWAAATA